MFVFEEDRDIDLSGLMSARVDRMRGEGQLVSFEQVGDPRLVPTPILRQAHWVVTIGLDNTEAHAGPQAPAVVRLVWLDDAVQVEVVDDGPHKPRPDWMYWPAKGLNGLRERVKEVGGVIEAGRLPERGFLLQATLPTDPSRRIPESVYETTIQQLGRLATSGSVHSSNDPEALGEALYSTVTGSAAASIAANQTMLVARDLTQR